MADPVAWPYPEARREALWLGSHCAQEARGFWRWPPSPMAPELVLEKNLGLEMELQVLEHRTKSQLDLDLAEDAVGRRKPLVRRV